MQKENREFFRTEMFNGFDTDQTMLRIGAMNMMLHGVDAPNIVGQDSLSNDNTDANRYTLCLANPPFSGRLDKETIARSLLQVANTTKTELLFVALFLRSLKLGGRCASIVPDGIISNKAKAYKAIRKELVDNQRLQAVIFMPSGVFYPYSGVSTAILIFTKTNTPNSTDRVWFYEMHADGFTLDQNRTPCAENDIPDVISRFHNLDAEASRSRKDQSFFVPVEEIRANDYDLTFNKYKEVERKVVEYDAPETILAHIDDLQSQIAEGLANLQSIINHLQHTAIYTGIQLFTLTVESNFHNIERTLLCLSCVQFRERTPRLNTHLESMHYALSICQIYTSIVHRVE
jgi:type I restriction enzyme M protein